MPGAWTACLLGLALVLAGLGFASPSLLVPGIAFVGLSLGAAAWVELAARSLCLVRARGPARIVEGELYPLRIEARGGLRPPPGSELCDPLLDRSLAIGPRWSRLIEVEVPIGRRGRRRLGPARLEIRDPLRLRSRTVRSEPGGELLVLPRVEPVVVAGRGSAGALLARVAGVEDATAASRLETRAVEMEVDGLRPHRRGIPASRIHWPAVARTGELIERRLVAGADSGPLVALDAKRPADLAALDDAVRAAASLCFALATAGGCIALIPGERHPLELEPEGSSWAQVHARLAAVEGGAPGAQLARLAHRGVVFWVTADARPSLPPGLRAAGSGTRYLVAPTRLLRGQAVFTVGGCAGQAAAGRPRRSRPLRRVA